MSSIDYHVPIAYTAQIRTHTRARHNLKDTCARALGRMHGYGCGHGRIYIANDDGRPYHTTTHAIAGKRATTTNYMAHRYCAKPKKAPRYELKEREQEHDDDHKSPAKPSKHSCNKAKQAKERK